MERDETRAERKRSRRLFVIASLAVVIAGVLLTVLTVRKEHSLAKETRLLGERITSGDQVVTAVVRPAPETRQVTVTGEARPYATATLYGKISGYVKEIRVDKGDRVQAGQILAVLESPELDRQVDAAKADAKAKRDDAKRAYALLGKNAIAYQDWERLDALAQVAEATAASLLAQKEYELIRAPFSGTVAIRYVDPGALVQAALNAQTTALPVLSLSRTDRLRVYVYLDQRNANLVRAGDRALVADSSRPAVRVSALVTRMSGELDTRTRTLLTEVEVDNRKGAIKAGSFVEVTLWLRAGSHVAVPAAALLLRRDVPYVAVVAPDGRIFVRPVTIADTDGITLRLSHGVSEGEQVVLNPPAGIDDGQHVRPAAGGK